MKNDKLINESLFNVADCVNPVISIIFPNFNGGNFVLKTVESLLKLNYPPENYEIIIVDNGSTDESCGLIKENYIREIKNNRIKLIELPKNIGAPSAYNIGIKNARSDYQFVFKTDNDLVLDRDCINALIEPFKLNRNIGVTGGKVLYYFQRDRLHLIGSIIRPFYAGGKGIGKYKLDNKSFNRPIKIDAVNGCMMLIKREVFEKVGLLDENYFLYFDDIDFSLRAKRMGFKQQYCYTALAFHNTATPNKRFQSERWLYFAIYNGFYFMKKHYKGINFIIFFLALNLKVSVYLFGIFMNNEINSQKKLFNTVFGAYNNGLTLLRVK